jgi:hypothetical protein
MKNRKTKTNVRVIEMVADPSLAKQNAKASKVLKRFFPNARGLQLYRTAEGEIGIQIDLDLSLVIASVSIRHMTPP